MVVIEGLFKGTFEKSIEKLEKEHLGVRRKWFWFIDCQNGKSESEVHEVILGLDD